MTEKEFTTIFMPCHRKMYATAMVIVGDWDLASDIVQDAYVKLWQRRNELEGLENVEGYCITVAKRLSIDKVRSRSYTSVTALDDRDFSDDSHSARCIESADSARHLHSLIEQLPERQRRALTLSVAAGLDNAAIGSAMQIPDGNVRTLLCRARKRLKQLFENER